MAGNLDKPLRALGAALIIAAAAGSSSGAVAADPPSRAAAIAAADAAAGIANPADAGVPVCADPPASGEKLAGDMSTVGEGHGMQVTNAGGGDALVNIRHADTRKLAMRFYLRSNEEMTIEGVPDGVYILQYAFGPALAIDCKTFTRIIRARELPEADELRTQVIDDDEKTEVRHRAISYEISVSESGNVKPVNIDAASFNAE